MLSEPLGPAWLLRLLGNALCAASLSLGVAGCATWQAPADFQRRSAARTRRDRLQAGRARDGGGAERRGQPAHVRRRRQQDRRAVGMDRSPEPDTASPCGCCGPEPTPTTSRRSKSRGPCTRRSRGKRTRASTTTSTDSRSRIPILPGATRAGVLFINPERLTRLLNIDLLRRKALDTLLAVPACAGRRRRSAFCGDSRSATPMPAVTDYKDLAALRAALERLPCCASDARGVGAAAIR